MAKYNPKPLFTCCDECFQMVPGHKINAVRRPHPRFGPRWTVWLCDECESSMMTKTEHEEATHET